MARRRVRVRVGAPLTLGPARLADCCTTGPAEKADLCPSGQSSSPARRRASYDQPSRGSRMKLVIGIVRPEKVNDVLEALYRAQVRGISLSRVQGHGGELDHVENYRGTRVQMGL